MTLRRRIMLIISGIAVFTALGPLIVLMAHGYRYDFDDGNLVVTGTLVIKNEERGATVELNDTKLNDTPVTKRFLTPDKYEVEITKNGYRTWRKRVNIYERQVTFLPSQNEKISLLLSEARALKTEDNVGDIFAFEDSIFFLNVPGTKIFQTSFDTSVSRVVASSTLALPEARFIDARFGGGGPEFILKSRENYWYVSGDIRYMLPSVTGHQFAGDAGTVLGINSKNDLLRIERTSVSVIANDVLAFKKNGEQIYYLTKLPAGQFALMRTVDGTRSDKVIDIPSFANGSIVLSTDNQVFLLLDRELYEVKDNLAGINSNVDSAYWDIHGHFLLYGNSHETWAYESLANIPNRLLLRSTVQTLSPFYHKGIAYAFLVEGNEIKAVEGDSSGQPNIYSLLTSEVLKKISLNEDGDVLAVLDGQSLKLVLIR